MKKNRSKKISFIFIFSLLIIFVLSGCGRSDKNREKNYNGSSTTGNQNSGSNNGGSENTEDGSGDDADSKTAVTELEVRFGDKGEPFTMHLYDNATAAAIARHVGTADWRLPIYHYNDYDNWEVMQYYDIPSRYDIPSNPENITSEKAGEVYYSEPNRIVLFFGDAEVSGEYTKVGYFDYTEEFRSAVENNPVLQGWGNKIVLINSMD